MLWLMVESDTPQSIGQPIEADQKDYERKEYFKPPLPFDTPCINGVRLAGHIIAKPEVYSYSFRRNPAGRAEKVDEPVLVLLIQTQESGPGHHFARIRVNVPQRLWDSPGVLGLGTGDLLYIEGSLASVDVPKKIRVPGRKPSSKGVAWLYSVEADRIQQLPQLGLAIQGAKRFAIPAKLYVDLVSLLKEVFGGSHQMFRDLHLRWFPMDYKEVYEKRGAQWNGERYVFTARKRRLPMKPEEILDEDRPELTDVEVELLRKRARRE